MYIEVIGTIQSMTWHVASSRRWLYVIADDRVDIVLKVNLMYRESGYAAVCYRSEERTIGR
jgi:hypothetical protein